MNTHITSITSAYLETEASFDALLEYPYNRYYFQELQTYLEERKKLEYPYN